MNEHLLETVARQQIKERVSRAAAPRVRGHQRHQLATRLRRVADRLDG
jgi:hypothetical protein